MCGLAGLIMWDSAKTASRHMAAALDSIQSRGPDGRSVWQDGQCALGHLRLAIIDLSENASQPMFSPDERYVIVFNGEIYNYQEIRNQIGDQYPWRTQGDTEVILAAYLRWGEDCLHQFRGMFAFAIWDRVKKSLFAARDRVGVKPLYFHASEQCFAFASRPRAIRHLIPDISLQFDQQALRYYLESGYIPAPHSYFEAIRKLEPGHYLTVSLAGIEVHRYWSIDKVPIDPAKELMTEEQLLDQLDGLIDRAVQLRLVSNVPVGAFLSGGIDSSVVAAYMKKHATGEVKTFTIGFEDAEFDESRHAAAVAQHLGTNHFCEQLTAQDLLALMPKYLAEYDEPFFDYSAFPVMAVSRAARRQVTVCLSGDGADEAFGGYHYYRLAEDFSKLRRMPALLRRGIAAILKRLPSHKINLLAGALTTRGVADTFAFMRSVIKDFKQVMGLAMINNTQPLSAMFSKRVEKFSDKLSDAEVAMRLDMDYTLSDDYLQKVDVGSMAFSLEAREPLLDHCILEWAASLPLKWKVRGGVNKYLLRQLAYRYIPRELLDRPKMGFSVPMATWLRSDLKQWAEDLLADVQTLTRIGLDHVQVMRVWNDHISERRNAQSCLWAILVLVQFVKNIERET